MPLRCVRDSSRFLIEAEGSLGIDVAGEMKSALLEAASSGLDTHLDISHATSIDASGLQLLWAATRRTEAAIQSLTVAGDIPTTIESAMRNAGFNDLLGLVARKALHDSPIMPGACAHD